MKEKILLIACGMIEDEMRLAMKNSGIVYDTIWMKSDLHNTPDQLRDELQKKINENQQYDLILLAYGNCGQGLVGLVSPNTRLACLRMEDCIHVLLHNEKALKKIRGETYFLTKGWLECKRSLKEEYRYAIDRYGPKRAEMIMGIMFKNYKSLMLIDTGAYSMDHWCYCAKNLSQALKLDFKTISGDVGLLEMFLSLDWNYQVAEFPPGRPISKNDFGVECALVRYTGPAELMTR